MTGGTERRTASETGIDPHKYWEDRHKGYGADLRSVGNAVLSHDDNRQQIYEKAVLLANLLGSHGIGPGADLLDAGCGQGFFTSIFAEIGFNCAGIDVSRYAIEIAIPHSRAMYVCSPLETFVLDRRFDVCMCIDVLYHVLDDKLWARVVENLVRHAKKGGQICILENFENEAKSLHCRWRTMEDYESLSQVLGWRISQVHEFRASKVGVNKTIMFLQETA